MKITITKEFDSFEEAAAFIGAMDAERYGAATRTITPPLPPAPLGLEHGEQPKRPRKPRSDAGQARGAYNTKGGAVSSLVGATSPMPQVPAPSASSAAPVTSSAVEPPQAAQAPAAADLTLDAIRETLGKLHGVPGKGMEACIASLQKFGVLRLSDLPKEKYAEFEAYVRGQLPAAKVAG